MIHTFQLDDSLPEAKAFLEFMRTLDFISISEEVNLNEDVTQAIEEARKSYDKNGGKNHEQVMAEMRAKYPNAFKK